MLIVPVTLGIIFFLLYLNFRRVTDTLIVIACIPFALVGGVVLLWWLDYDFSVAVGAGFLALAGLTAETGVIMLLFLNQARDRCSPKGASTHAPRSGRPSSRARRPAPAHSS